MSGSVERLRADLRACIDAAGRHQATVAADLRVTRKHLCAMLTGRANLTLEWAERIAAACGHEVVVTVQPAGDRRQVALPLADVAFLYSWATEGIDDLPPAKLPPEPHLTRARARIDRIGEQLRAAN